jgi:hypothetical protein
LIQTLANANCNEKLWREPRGVALEELEDDHIVWVSGREHARRRPMAVNENSAW